MLARGLVPEHGVLAPERVDPQAFLDLMTEQGALWDVIDLPVDG
jgi:hypothetical protein